MFDGYTQRAHTAVMRAQQIAMQMGHPVVGTEHILLSLAAEEQSVAGRVLTQLGLSLQKLYHQLQEAMSGVAQAERRGAVSPRPSGSWNWRRRRPRIKP